MKKIVRISLILVNALVLSGPIFGNQNHQEETIEIPSDYASVVPVVNDGKLKKDCLVTFDELYKKSLESNGYLIVAKQEGQEFVMPLVSYKISSPENCEFFVAGMNQINAQNIEFFNITQNVKDLLQRAPEAKLYDLGERAFKGDLQTLSNLGLMAQPSQPVAYTPSMVVPVYVPVPFFVPVFTPAPAPVRPAQRQQRGRLAPRTRRIASSRIIPSITEIREESLEEKKALAESIILKAINDAVVQVEEKRERIGGVFQDEIIDEVIQEEALKIFNEFKEVEEKRKIKKDKEKEDKAIEGVIKDDVVGNLLDEIIKEEAPQILNELKIEKQKRKELESQSKNSSQAMSKQMTDAEIIEQDKKAALALAVVNKQDDDEEVISIDQADKDSKQKKNKKKKNKTEKQQEEEAQEELLMKQMQKEIDSTPIVKLPKYLLEICPLIDKSTNDQLNNYIKEIESLVKQQKKLFKKSTEEFYTVILFTMADSMILLCKIVMNINQLRSNCSEMTTYNSFKKLVVFEDNDFLINVLSTFSTINILYKKVLENKGKLFDREVDRKNIKNALFNFIVCYKSIFQKNSRLMIGNVIFHFKMLFNFKSIDGELEQASLEDNQLYNFMFDLQPHADIDRVAWVNNLLSLNIIQNSENLVLIEKD